MPSQQGYKSLFIYFLKDYINEKERRVEEEKKVYSLTVCINIIKTIKL